VRRDNKTCERPPGTKEYRIARKRPDDWEICWTFHNMLKISFLVFAFPESRLKLSLVVLKTVKEKGF
jgi:hypothetical protein